MLGPLESELQAVVSTQHGCWDPNSGPPKEECRLLTMDPYLQPQTVSLLNHTGYLEVSSFLVTRGHWVEPVLQSPAGTGRRIPYISVLGEDLPHGPAFELLNGNMCLNLSHRQLAFSWGATPSPQPTKSYQVRAKDTLLGGTASMFWIIIISVPTFI